MREPGRGRNLFLVDGEREPCLVRAADADDARSIAAAAGQQVLAVRRVGTDGPCGVLATLASQDATSGGRDD